MPSSRRSMVRGASAALLAGMLLLLPQQATRAGWTDVKAAPNGHFMVKATINGVTTSAVVDTGASVVAIPWRVAERIGLHPRLKKFKHPVATANGIVKAAPVVLRRVEIGPVVVRNVEALILPKGRLSVVLIGMSFLGKLRHYSVRDNVLRLKN